MPHPLIYIPLGFSRSRRAQRFRDNMLRKAECFQARGIPTRIPFLKKALCGIDVPDGHPSRESDAQAIAEGDVRAYRLGEPRDVYDFLDGIVRANSAIAEIGLQLIPCKTRPLELYRFVAKRCKTEWMGDLKLTTFEMMEPGTIFSEMAGGSAHSQLFQVFFWEKPPPWLRIHEIEHGIHFSLWQLQGLPPTAMGRISKEYTAMLAPLMKLGDGDIVFHFHVRPEDMVKTLIYKWPYVIASAKFALKFRAQGMRQAEMFLGASGPNDVSEYEGEADPEVLRRVRQLHAWQMQMKEWAEGEYDKMYRWFFGLGVDDIRQVVTDMPLI